MSCMERISFGFRNIICFHSDYRTVAGCGSNAVRAASATTLNLIIMHEERTPLIRRQTITKQVIDHLLGLIRSGEVKPGEQLPTEKQLTEKLAVSRTCVREAIKS